MSAVSSFTAFSLDRRIQMLRTAMGPLIAAGKLVPVLPQYRQEANIWAVYPSRLNASAKVRVCVDFLEAHLRQLDAGD